MSERQVEPQLCHSVIFSPLSFLSCFLLSCKHCSSSSRRAITHTHTLSLSLFPFPLCSSRATNNCSLLHCLLHCMISDQHALVLLCPIAFLSLNLRADIPSVIHRAMPIEKGRSYLENTSSRGLSSNRWLNVELKLKPAQLGVCEWRAFGGSIHDERKSGSESPLESPLLT